MACMEESRGIHRVLEGKHEGKRPPGRTRRKWDDNIKMDIQKIGWGIAWIDLARYRDRWLALANAVMSLRDP